ncbi:MAG: aldehyde dehydrogenase family protein [Frankiaceae bacterium]
MNGTSAKPGLDTLPPAPGAVPPVDRARLNEAVAAVRTTTGVWAVLPAEAKATLLGRVIKDTVDAAGEWVAAAAAAKRLDVDGQAASEEWLAGPYPLIRHARLLRRSLRHLSNYGVPRLPAPARTGPDGRLRVRVFPTDMWDRLVLPGTTAEVQILPGVTAGSMQAPAQLHRYPPGGGEAAGPGGGVAAAAGGGVALVLGAGNSAAISPRDAVHQFCVGNRTVVVKTSPVNDYLRPLDERCLAALVEPGFVRFVDGGAAEGEYLCSGPDIDTIHITGSRETYEAVVFGRGPDHQARKRRNEPVLGTPVTAELGNVSPVIVVPGPWSASDLNYQSEHIASMVVNNAGFNCVTPRVLVTQAGWPQREELLARLRSVLQRVPARHPYYPGAAGRFRAFLDRHPEAWRAEPSAEVPWTVISAVDPDAADDICFTTEAFCAVLAETALPVQDPADYIDAATRFCNEKLWGTLGTTLLVHPDTTSKDPRAAAALQRATGELRYGTIAVNAWHALGYTMTSPPWGAYPGATRQDIQSGTGMGGNTYFLSDVEKTLIRAPWRQRPKPILFPSSRTSLQTTRLLTEFESKPSLRRLSRVLAAAMRS